MNKIELAEYLSSRIHSKNLHICIPILGYTFGNDNSNELRSTIAKINHCDTPVFVRQLTRFDSPVLCNKDKYLPIKRIAMIILHEHEITLISKEETAYSFSFNAGTGEPVDPPQDLKFIDADKLLDIIK
jgi:hypothetical protein